MSYQNKINRGLRPQDEAYTRLHDNPTASPDIQMFTYEDLEDQPEERKYYCSLCKGKLQLLQGLGEWYCMPCGQHYDINLWDTPIKDKKPFKLKPFMEFQHNPTYDEEDSNLPFAEGIEVDDLVEDTDDVTLVNNTPDNRVQHIRVKGDITKALSAQHNYDQ